MFKQSLDNKVIQVVDAGLGNSSYVVDLGDGSSLIVDPERDPRPYLRASESRHLKPRLVIETHLHADFVSGAGELVAVGADLLAPAGSDLSFPHRALHDDEEIDLGGLTIQVVATPGHTPEHLSYLLVDDSRPVALFSGGTLVSGGVARTDLLTPDQTEPLARAAYRSIRERLFRLSDELVVYPTHGGGSFCSVGSGSEPTTTIGREKYTNPLLSGDPDEDTFVERLTTGYGSYPPYFLELRAVNREGVEVFGTSPPTLPKLSALDVVAAITAGAEVVDARSIRDFSTAHIPDAISIPWRNQFATWLGWLVPRTSPVVFITDESVDRDDLVWAALTVGFEELVGELDGGMAAWQEAGQSVGSVPLTDTDPGSRTIIDVRQESEYRAGHLPEAIHVELGALARAPGELPHGPLLVHCGHGERAMSAASLLARSGHEDVVVFDGSPSELGPLRTDASA